MLFSLFVIVFVGIIAYWHYLQGFFSAAISAILAIVAALVALGYQEEVVALAGGKFNDQANAIALVCLFSITYFILRVIFDKLIPGNVRFPVMLDRIGAPIMGVFAGLFAVGIWAIAAQTLPFGPSIAGYQRFRVDFDKPIVIRMPNKQAQVDAVYDEIDGERFLNGDSQGLWIGVDDMVLNVMKKVSAEDGPLSRGLPFANVHPDYLQEIFGQRSGLQSGASRTANPGGTSVQSVHIVGALMQVDPERWSMSNADVGIRGNSRNPQPPPLDPQRKPPEGKTLLVVRTHFSRDDADKKTNMVNLSAANIRLVAKSTETTPARFKNYFPIGTLEGGQILYVSAPDDFLFVPADKSADLVFEVDEDGVFTPADSSDRSAPRRIQQGVFLEVKRLARVSLAGMTAQHGVPASDQVEVVRKEGAPPNAIVTGGTNTGGKTAGAKAAPLAVDADATLSSKLFTPLNVGGSGENERNGLAQWGSFALQNKKFSKIDMQPTQSIALMARGDNLVSEFAVPPENAMVQVVAQVAQGHSKWEWGNNLGDLRLVDTAGKRYVPYGALAKVKNQNQEMLAAIYDFSKPAASLTSGDEFTPTQITLIYLVPKGIELKSLDYKEETLRPVSLKVP